MSNAGEPGTSYDANLLAQVRESFGRVVYSHKAQEKQADICFTKHRLQQGILIALTAISSGTFLAALLGSAIDPVLASLVTSFIALLVTAAGLATKTFRFSDEADAHRDVATQLWDVRESYVSLISDLMSGGVSAVQARTRRDELQESAREIYALAPRTTNRAFRKAGDGLKNNEELTFTAHEIDLFLPEGLRLKAGGA